MKRLSQSELSEAKQLVSNIRIWKKAYYNGHPLVSDQVYDGAEMRLKQLIPDHPVFLEVGAPSDGFEQINYVDFGADKMLSLDKVYSIEEVIKFIGNYQYVPMVKLDGMSLRVVYENKKIKVAHTRGNGTVGDVVSNNFYFVNGSVPEKWPDYRFEVRGEVVMLNKDFEELNKERQEKGEELFSNPRNAAAGSLKQKDFLETASRNLTYFVYSLKIDGKRLSKMQQLTMLEEMGFKTARIKNSSALVSIQACIEETTKFRDKLPVAIDGLVFALDDVDLRESLGCTNHHPRYELAYKFASEQGETKLIRKEWDITRTRRVVPVGIIDPIELSGAVCSRVTLHNAKFVYDNRISDGEMIVIERSGDVIPHFLNTVKPIDQISKEGLNIPKECPACKTKLVLDGVDLLCPNTQCKGASVKLIKHYISKPVTNMDGIGEKLIDQLVEKGIVNNPSDLFRVTKYQLMTLDRMGDKKADNALATISEARTQTPEVFLMSLGIDCLGKDVSAKIADIVNFDTMEVISKLTDIEGIAETTETAIINGLKETKWLSDELKKYVKIEKKQSTFVKNTLNGKSFCVSGHVELAFADETFYDDRDSIQLLIKNFGGVVLTSVSKKLDYLVAGDGSGSKSDKAKEYGISIITGDELVKMMES